MLTWVKCAPLFMPSSDPAPTLALETGAGRAVSCVWSPNSKTIIGGCSDGSILVWSASNGSVFTALNGVCVYVWKAWMCFLMNESCPVSAHIGVCVGVGFKQQHSFSTDSS